MLQFIKSILIENEHANDPEFKRLIYIENARRLVLTLSLIFILEFIIMIFEFIRYDASSIMMDFAHKKPILLVFLLLSILYFYKATKKGNELKDLQKKESIILYAFLIIIIFWGFTTTLHVQNVNGELSVLILTTIGIAATLYIRPVATLILYISTYVLFIVMLPTYQTNPELIVSHYWNLFASLSLAWIIARSIYNFRLELYLDRTIIQEQNSVLQDLASKDGLTKLYNHRHLYEKLREHLELSKTCDSELAIALLDLDGFKHVNDTYGHLFGDKVLKTFAQILNDHTRTSDIVGRYGGEEFLIIFPNTSLDNAYLVTDRIRRVLSETTIDDVQITVSGGLVSYSDHNLHSFIHDADILLYRAKESGKNKIISSSIKAVS